MVASIAYADPVPASTNHQILATSTYELGQFVAEGVGVWREMQHLRGQAFQLRDATVPIQLRQEN
jgi:hypothetical protein